MTIAITKNYIMVKFEWECTELKLNNSVLYLMWCAGCRPQNLFLKHYREILLQEIQTKYGNIITN